MRIGRNEGEERMGEKGIEGEADGGRRGCREMGGMVKGEEDGGRRGWGEKRMEGYGRNGKRWIEEHGKDER